MQNTEVHNLIQAGEGFHLELKETGDDSFFTVTCIRKAETAQSTTQSTAQSAVVETVVETVGENLTAILKTPKITRGELSQITGLTIRGVEWNLAKLKEQGLLKRIGTDFGGHWEVILTRPPNRLPFRSEPPINPSPKRKNKRIFSTGLTGLTG